MDRGHSAHRIHVPSGNLLEAPIGAAPQPQTHREIEALRRPLSCMTESRLLGKCVPGRRVYGEFQRGSGSLPFRSAQGCRGLGHEPPDDIAVGVAANPVVNNCVRQSDEVPHLPFDRRLP